MEEHLDSHSQAPVQAPSAVPVAQAPNAQVQVAAAMPAPVPADQPTPTIQQSDQVPTIARPDQVASATQQPGDVITWEASEHVDYNNGFGWTLLMALGGVVLAVVIYLLVDLMSAIVVLILLGGVVFYSQARPRNVRYTVSSQGISVSGRNYSFSDFRSFSIDIDEGLTSIFLVPMQRFMAPITMYVVPENQDQIAEILAQHLPNKQRQPDFMDRLTAKLRL